MGSYGRLPYRFTDGDPCGVPERSVLPLSWLPEKGAPDSFRGGGHVDVGGAGGLQGIADGVHDRGGGARRGVFPCAFDAEGVVGLRQLVQRDGQRRQVVGTREDILHEAARQRLAGSRLETNVLHQGLPDPLSGASVHLAMHDQRIDGPSDVGHDDVALDPQRAIVGVHEHLAGVTAIGVDISRGREIDGGREPAGVASATPATSKRPTPRSVPATVNRPVAYITSAAAASSISAARDRPSSISFRAPTTTAPPPRRADRDPAEPAPRATRSVSPNTTSMRSNGTPSASAAICEKTVSWPIPKS